MNLFGGCGCGNNSSCDVLTWIILINLISGCGCNSGCNNGCGCGCESKGCGCGIDICTLMLLSMFCGNGNKCCCK